MLACVAVVVVACVWLCVGRLCVCEPMLRPPAGNTLSGSFPVSVTTLTALTYLGLFENSLGGTLPSGISALSNLVCVARRGP
jgi:hypothetical protein